VGKIPILRELANCGSPAICNSLVPSACGCDRFDNVPRIPRITVQEDVLTQLAADEGAPMRFLRANTQFIIAMMFSICAIGAALT